MPFASAKSELSRCGQSCSRTTQNSLNALRPFPGKISINFSTLLLALLTKFSSSLEMTLFLTRWIKIGSRSTLPSSCLCFRSSLDIRFLELLVDILIRTTVSHFTESLHDYWMGWIINLPSASDWLINSLAFTNQRRPAHTHSKPLF